jgi:hypothetical protein
MVLLEVAAFGISGSLLHPYKRMFGELPSKTLARLNA